MPRPERSVDPTDGPVARFAVGLRELRHETGSPGYRELARRAHFSATTLAQAARGVSLPSLAVTVAFVRACGGDVAEWERRWRATEAELNPQSPAAAPDEGDGANGRAPYVGLAAYGPEDAEWFRGRDGVVATLTERVARQRFVAVVGASGAGKSSVLRAGLLPALDADGDRWSTLVMTPGAKPSQECAVQLGAWSGLASGRLVAELVEDPGNLGLAIRQLMTTRHDRAECVLVVDQFEEIFTLCQDRAERDWFVAALLDAARCADSRTRVVVGLRADFYAHCARHGQLVEALQDAQVLVGPMNTGELVEAVTEPAVRAGLMVEKTLVATVVHDAAEQPGALPFVSHALWETWRRRRGNGLFLTSYAAVGGLSGAIANTADRVYGDLDDRQQEAARGILLRLTALGEGTEDTRRRVSRAELGTDPAVLEVIDRLAAARLITLAEDTVEIAHEALIRGWPALREWLAADRETLRAHRRLTDAAAEWDRQGRDEGHLYRGSVLAAWYDRDDDALNDVERAFLSASVTRQGRERFARQRRLRRSLVGAVAVVVVVSVLAVLALVVATRAAEERDVALARQLAANARAQLQVDPELAMLLAIEAMEIEPIPEADAVLRQSIVDSRVLATLPTGHGQAQGVAFSQDGRRIATTGDDAMVRIWEQATPGGPWSVRSVLRGGARGLSGPVFSPDGRYLAVAGEVSPFAIWDLDHPDLPAVMVPHSSPDADQEPAFSDDGHLMAAAGRDHVRVWDIASPGLPNFPGAETVFALDGACDVAFSRTAATWPAPRASTALLGSGI